MYWYYKIPLCGLALLAAFGLVYLLWTRLPVDVRQSMPWHGETPGEEKVEPAPGTGGDAEPAPGPSAPRTVVPPAGLKRELEQRLAAATEQLGKGKLLAARELARKVVEDKAVARFGVLWRRAVDVVSEANTVLINSDAPAPEKVAYVIQSGDNLVGIAKRFDTTVAALQRGNNLESTSAVIYPGAVLYIYQGRWSITVNKEHFALVLLDGESIFKVYRVGIGRQDRTPVGIFQVNNKLPEPAWHPPGRAIPYGHPDNVLGTRWLGIAPIEGTDPSLRSYGIHGTWEPETVGTAASEGCVRMLNEEVNELFDIVPVGTRVTIANE